MRFKQYIINERAPAGGVNFQNHMKKISNKPAKAVEKIFKDGWIAFEKVLKSHRLEQDAIDIINKHLKTNYKNLSQITKATIAKIPTKKLYEEEDLLTEDFKHYWELIKTEMFPIVSFWPALQAWLEIDKLIKSTGEANYTALAIYGIFWVFLVSGKYLLGWKKWKKENPEEYKKEKEAKKA
jgi:hypothetical protein